MKITVLDAATLGDDISFDSFFECYELIVYKTTSPENVIKRIADADVIIVNKIILNENNLADAKNLKLICVAATGYDNIDIEYCKKNKIAVCNVPGYSTDSVAQLTLSMVLSLIVHLDEYKGFVHSGSYSQSGCANRLVPVWHELSGLTWGIVGGGNIGQRVADIAKAFGCNVIMFRRKADPCYETVDIDTLCEKSDIISIHLPLTDDTRNIISRERISKMKKTAILVNVARGAITDENALADAVENGMLGALGVDVFSVEPMNTSHPFNRILDNPNVCFTPHIAWGSYESRYRCIYKISENINTFFNGGTKNRII